MNYWHDKRTVVTGGSAGLGRSIAEALVSKGARVAVVARSEAQLAAVARELRSTGGDVLAIRADVTSEPDVRNLSSTVFNAWGGLDMLCHCVGRSMRGTALATSVEEFRDMLNTNFLSAVGCTQAFASGLTQSRGHLILIGSLASKVASGYLGAYPASKFPLAALAQQLRMELGETAFHTLFVCPGPIARESPLDGGGRYQGAADVPASAHQPGGGAKVRACDPRWLAERILNACERRRSELVIPPRARLLFAASQLAPRFGDWLLRRMTSR